MAKKIALCRVSDTEPLLSLVRMLEYVGYECVLPDRGLRNYLRGIDCLNVDEFKDLQANLGAEMPPSRLREVNFEDLIGGAVDLYVDVNAFRNGPLLWHHWPALERRTLCYFINGGPPRDTVDKGNGIEIPCPVITTNRWYAGDVFQTRLHDGRWRKEEYWIGIADDGSRKVKGPWRDKSYVFWPSFERWDRVLPRRPDLGGSPVCFCHNVYKWGYGEYIDSAADLGVKFYGGGSTTHRMVWHEDLFEILAKAPCVVYLKGGGAVDYAVLEAMAAGCPVLFPVKYSKDTRTEELMGLCGALDDRYLLQEIETAVDLYRDPVRNAHLGEWGRQRVEELCWRPERDGPGFVGFMERMGFL